MSKPRRDEQCTEYLRDDQGRVLYEENERTKKRWPIRCTNELAIGVDPAYLELTKTFDPEWLGEPWPLPNPLRLCHEHLARRDDGKDPIATSPHIRVVDASAFLDTPFTRMERAIAEGAARMALRRKAHHWFRVGPQKTIVSTLTTSSIAAAEKTFALTVQPAPSKAKTKTNTKTKTGKKTKTIGAPTPIESFLDAPPPGVGEPTPKHAPGWSELGPLFGRDR